MSGLIEKILRFIKSVFGSSKAAGPKTFSYGPASLDIYSNGSSGLPVVMFIHGGSWKEGNRVEAVKNKPAFFLKHGFCFVSTDTRLLPGADVGTQANDVLAAYQWLKTHIAQHGGDPARIGVMGHSSGCHLAALTGMRGDLTAAKALLLIDTLAYDLTQLAADGGLTGDYAAAFPDPKLWPVLSPATYVDGHIHPKTMVAWSGEVSRAKAGKTFAARLMSTGTEVVTFDGPGYSHTSINEDFGKDGDPLSAAALSFLLGAF